MDLFFKTQLNSAEKKMASYMTLLNFRYMNLCVKAEAAALIPVTVSLLGQDMNIEEVADVAIVDEYHLAVIPKNDEYLEPITRAVTFSHPEFKLSMKTTKMGAEERKMLEYEMPEVDKNRYDLLNQAVKSLYDEAKVKVDQVYADEKAGYIELLSQNPENLDEVNSELDRIHDETLRNILGSRDDKLMEIEDGYLRYLTQHSEHDSADDDSGFDVTKSMVMHE